MNSILATFHYVPLHSSDKGRKCGVFQGNDVYTTSESQKLVRLPLYYCMSDEEVDKVCAKIYEFFETTQSPVREN
jgi:dTDP-4-amino-4,6-dideoxygalactose transaminase